MRKLVLLLVSAVGVAVAHFGNGVSLETHLHLKPPRGYSKLVFDDEFNGRRLDMRKWQPNWLAPTAAAITGPVSIYEHNCYDPRNVAEGDGVLTLSVVARRCRVNGRWYPYRSAIVESNRRFNFTYGYMQARMWLPPGTGMWPAFWADGQKWPYDGEIDVMEDDGTDNPTFHYRHYGGIYGGSARVPGATAGWHTYAASWNASRIRWFYDGRLVGQTRTAHNAPMYLIINLGTRDYPSAVPNKLKVDWVRVWQ
jgi:beta-glucanase (GH16 family)